MTSALPLSHGRESETFAAPPRPGDEQPIVVERAFGDWRTSLDLEWAAVARALPPPFQRVLDVRQGEGVELVLERFIGVDGLSVLRALEDAHRVLPLDVWLGLALAWGGALTKVPVGSEGWRTPADVSSVGADVRGHLVLTFDTPNHLLGRWTRAPPHNVGVLTRIPQSVSPEHVRDLDVGEPSRVFSLAAALCMLLQGARLFGPDTSVVKQLTTIALEDLPWNPARHPSCPQALVATLRRALSREASLRFPDLPAFLEALEASAGVAPASEERVVSVLLSVGAEKVRANFDQLARDPSVLPPAWASGGLQVLQDRLLERLVPIDQLPAAAGPTPEPRPPDKVKVNLFTGPAKPRSGWRRFWPF